MGGQTDPVADGKPSETQSFYSGSRHTRPPSAERLALKVSSQDDLKANPELARSVPEGTIGCAARSVRSQRKDSGALLGAAIVNVGS